MVMCGHEDGKADPPLAALAVAAPPDPVARDEADAFHDGRNSAGDSQGEKGTS